MSQLPNIGAGLVDAEGYELTDADGLVVDAGCAPECCDGAPPPTVCCLSGEALAELLGAPQNDCGRGGLNPDTKHVCVHVLEAKITSEQVGGEYRWYSQFSPDTPENCRDRWLRATSTNGFHESHDLVRPVRKLQTGCRWRVPVSMIYRRGVSSEAFEECTGRRSGPTATNLVQQVCLDVDVPRCWPIGSSAPRPGFPLGVWPGGVYSWAAGGYFWSPPMMEQPEFIGTRVTVNGNSTTTDTIETQWNCVNGGRFEYTYRRVTVVETPDPGPPSSPPALDAQCRLTGICTANAWGTTTTIREVKVALGLDLPERCSDGAPGPSCNVVNPDPDPCDEPAIEYLLATDCPGVTGERPVVFPAENVQGCAVVNVAGVCRQIGPSAPRVRDPSTVGPAGAIVDFTVIPPNPALAGLAQTCCDCDPVCDGRPVLASPCWGQGQRDLNGNWVPAPVYLGGGVCCCFEDDEIELVRLESSVEYSFGIKQTRELRPGRPPVRVPRGQLWSFETLDRQLRRLPEGGYVEESFGFTEWQMGPWTCPGINTPAVGGGMWQGLGHPATGFGPQDLQVPHDFAGVFRSFDLATALLCPTAPNGAADPQNPLSVRVMSYAMSVDCERFSVVCRFRKGQGPLGDDGGWDVETALEFRIHRSTLNPMRRCGGGCGGGIVFNPVPVAGPGGGPGTFDPGPGGGGGGGLTVMGGCGGCGGGGGFE